MRVRQVRLRQGEYDCYLDVEGTGTLPLSENGDDFIGPIAIAGPAGLTSLRHALVKHAGSYSPPPRTVVHPETGEEIVLRVDPGPYRAAVELVDVPPAKFAQRHSYEFVPEPVDVVLREGGRLAVRVQFVVEGDHQPDLELRKGLLAPLLRRTRSAIDGIDTTAEGPYDFRTSFVVTNADFWVVNVYLTVPTRGRDVASATAIGRDALAILEAAERGSFTWSSAQSLIEAGRADLLIGQPETSWLECKEQPYQDTEHGRLELAKDVCAFANTREGGLILIGLRTHSRSGQDIITRLRPVPTDVRLPDRYRRWIDQWMFPRPANLQIRNVPHGAHSSVVVIAVPPQPPALIPFLVKGLLKDGRTIGTHMAVFARHGDAVVHTGAEEFHSLLVAGRVALGYEPPAHQSP